MESKGVRHRAHLEFCGDGVHGHTRSEEARRERQLPGDQKAVFDVAFGSTAAGVPSFYGRLLSGEAGDSKGQPRLLRSGPVLDDVDRPLRRLNREVDMPDHAIA